MGEFEKLLNGIAREAGDAFADSIRADPSDSILDVLKRRLLPLLEAGAEYRKLHALRTRNWRAREYDVAFEAAKVTTLEGGRKGKKERERT